MNVLVINGPNINMLGIREPGIYGTQNYEALVAICEEAASACGFTRVECFQSNHEGEIVDKIQQAYGSFDGIVINPAAYKAVALPAVEIHISAVEDREDFRQVSYAGMACFERVTGEGLEGYAHAIRILAHRLSSEA